MIVVALVRTHNRSFELRTKPKVNGDVVSYLVTWTKTNGLTLYIDGKRVNSTAGRPLLMREEEEFHKFEPEFSNIEVNKQLRDQEDGLGEFVSLTTWKTGLLPWQVDALYSSNGKA